MFAHAYCTCSQPLNLLSDFLLWFALKSHAERVTGSLVPKPLKCTFISIYSVDIAAMCAANSSSRVPNPLNCAQYYDCRKRSTLGKSHLLECPYPQLFSNISMACEDFQKVDCAQRYEPMAPCKITFI